MKSGSKLPKGGCKKSLKKIDCWDQLNRTSFALTNWVVKIYLSTVLFNLALQRWNVPYLLRSNNTKSFFIIFRKFIFLMGHTRPLFLFLNLLNLTANKRSLLNILMDSNPGPLVSEVTAIPTVPKILHTNLRRKKFCGIRPWSLIELQIELSIRAYLS